MSSLHRNENTVFPLIDPRPILIPPPPDHKCISSRPSVGPSEKIEPPGGSIRGNTVVAHVQ